MIEKIVCPTCKGEGYLIDTHKVTAQWDDGIAVACPRCDGDGWVIGESEAADQARAALED